MRGCRARLAALTPASPDPLPLPLPPAPPSSQDDWSRVLSSPLPLKGKVVKANSGGLVLRLAGTALLAFLPLSHLDPARLRAHALTPAQAGKGGGGSLSDGHATDRCAGLRCLACVRWKCTHPGLPRGPLVH